MFRLLLVLIFTTAAVARAADICLDPLLRQVYSDHVDSEDYYFRGECFTNSACLGNAIATRFSQNVNQDELKVVIIHNASYDPFNDRTMHDTSFTQLIAGRQPRFRPELTHDYILWRFHAVLRYRDQILDLDLASREPLPVEKYFDTMFAPVEATEKRPRFNDRSDLVVREIPVTEITALPRWLYARRDQVALARLYPQIPLTDYLVRP